MTKRLQSLFADRLLVTGPAGVVIAGDASARAVAVPESRLKIERRLMESNAEGGGHVWKSAYVSDTEITITGGTLRYGINTFTPDGSAVTVTADVLNYVYAKIACTTTFNAGYLSTATVSGVTFEASTTAQTDTETEKYVLLFEWENNTLKTQHLYWSLGVSFYTDAEDVSGLRTWAAG